MNRITCEDFFLQPGGTRQRRYEVLRAIFVDDDTAVDVAERFDLSHGTVRNWVSQFSTQLERGEPPPFSMAGVRRTAG
jgi:transposase-like protein